MARLGESHSSERRDGRCWGNQYTKNVWSCGGAGGSSQQQGPNTRRSNSTWCWEDMVQKQQQQSTRITLDAEDSQSTISLGGERWGAWCCRPASHSLNYLKCSSQKMWKSLEIPPHISPHQTHFQVLPNTISKFSVLKLLFSKWLQMPSYHR